MQICKLCDYFKVAEQWEVAEQIVKQCKSAEDKRNVWGVWIPSDTSLLPWKAFQELLDTVL